VDVGQRQRGFCAHRFHDQAHGFRRGIDQLHARVPGNTAQIEFARATNLFQSASLVKQQYDEAKGRYEVRFCFYDHRGGFQRSPMILDEAEFDAMRKALAATPKLKKIISKLVR
jgi:hypothetical protein